MAFEDSPAVVLVGVFIAVFNVLMEALTGLFLENFPGLFLSSRERTTDFRLLNPTAVVVAVIAVLGAVFVKAFEDSPAVVVVGVFIAVMEALTGLFVEDFTGLFADLSAIVDDD
jgi:hypothetical protein